MGFTEGILLELSSQQAKLENAGQCWYPTEQSYWDTEDYDSKTFLGYKFGDITVRTIN